MLSLMIYEIILTFNFLIGSGVGGGGGGGWVGGIRHIDCFHSFLKRSFIDLKNDEVSQF